MRFPLALASAVTLLALSGVAAGPGCAAGSDTITGSTSSGAGGSTGGAGGVGGEACVPEDELCDGLDNDCDDDIDEDCPCIDGDTQPCYSGDPDLLGIGLCAEGEQTCDLTGAWGDCEGQHLPVDEECDGQDNDCDDEVDEELDEEVTCGLGICQVTVVPCVEGEVVPCIPTTANPSEGCDGLDDDCDGDVDEGCSCVNQTTQPCYSGPPITQNVGLCSGGTQTCANGGWGACVGETTPVSEQCDGFDNDCDGTPDDGDPNSGSTCPTGLFGLCAAGIQHCVNGSLACQQNVQPSAELCDGLDNNCDGGTDENNPEGGTLCNTTLPGVCAAGIMTCQNATLSCLPITPASAEQCNGFDDDCDGTVDNGNPGGGAACNTGLLGVCAAGMMTCTGGTVSCQPITPASTEVCNDNLDNNCDGSTDENCPACPPTLTSVFSDDFSSPSSSSWTAGAPAAVGSSIWTAYTSTYHGLRIDSGRLEITNKRDSSGPSHGHGYGYVKTGGSGSQYNNTLYSATLKNNAAQLVVWSFNMRRDDPDSTTGGFSCSSTYSQNRITVGLAYVLATDSASGLHSSTSTCSSSASGLGYAVVMGGSSAAVRLVRFSGGLRNGALTNIVSSGSNGPNDHFSLRVTYNAVTDLWQLEVRDDGETSFADPSAGTFGFTGTGTDATYVNTLLEYSGPYFQTGCTGNCSETYMTKFDNVDVGVVCAP